MLGRNSPADFETDDDEGTARLSYRIQAAPAVKGEEKVDYGQPKEDEEGENSSDEEKPALPTKKAAKKRVYAPELILLDPKPRLY